MRRVSIILIFALAAGFLLSVQNARCGDTLTVHYNRYADDYQDWTLWTWDDKTDLDSREIEPASKDDFGLIFYVIKSNYGDGSQIGLLPKFREWESKDPPDRIWIPELGDEVWILSGHPKIFNERPSEELMGKKLTPFIIVHYHRPGGDYAGWTLWTWDDRTDRDSRELQPIGSDDYGLIFKVERKNYGGDGLQIGLLPKFGNWVSKDPPDRIWYPFMGNEVWILAGSEELFPEKPDTTPWIIGAFVDGKRLITASLSAPLKGSQDLLGMTKVYDVGGKELEIESVRILPPRKGANFLVGITVARDLDVRKDDLTGFILMIEGFKPTNLTIRGILDEPEYQSDLELGAIYSPEVTTFRVFAPTASRLVVTLYDHPVGGKGVEYEAEYKDNGVWEVAVEGDLLGKYYTLKANGKNPLFNPNRELIDPYSRCNTAHNGRGMIIKDQTPIFPSPRFGIDEAIIYELHVRDFTIGANSGVRNRGKYLGLTETGTHLPEDEMIRTGIDHLEELGINVVQVMPIQDFFNDESSEEYNWGYMPVHFNSPDGWYATERYNSKRVEEFKRMVDALHRKGIKVVMDVVYNHTAEYKPDRIYSFEGLVPGYYYRLRDDGSYWNGSGTGNETRTEAPMMRKFIVESCKYWVEEYDVDGYRFDLMGLIDLATMEKIVDELRAIKPDILIYGEPWTAGESPVVPTLKGTQRGRGFAVFGDHFRDAIKGGVFDLSKGFVQAGINIDKVKRGIEGSINDFTDSPLEAINYVECHDNHTFWDRLVATTRNDPWVTDQERKLMNKLGAVLVFLSQGIPFIQSGQEMLRTKRGNTNSYNQPDAINMIDWRWKKENFDIYNYYRGLITLRKEHPLFRMKTREQVGANLKFLDDHLRMPVPPKCIGYLLSKGDTGDSWNQILVLLNPNPTEVTFSIPEGDWIVVVDDDEAGVEPVKTGVSHVKGSKVVLPRISAMVLYR